jgi:hypothetical protein
MASEQQIAANRANAKQSTGPKTEAGKTQSRKNAWRHGLTAKTLVIDGENPKDLDSLRAAFEVQFKPQNALQFELVERLAVTAWRLRRIPAFEAALIEARRAEVDGSPWLQLSGLRRKSEIGLALILDGGKEGALGKLSRYEAALLNVFNRTLQQLWFLQDREARELDAEPVTKVLPAPTHGDVTQAH